MWADLGPIVKSDLERIYTVKFQGMISSTWKYFPHLAIFATCAVCLKLHTNISHIRRTGEEKMMDDELYLSGDSLLC